MTDPREIDLFPQNPDQIDLNAPATPDLTADQIQSRADKYSYAMGEDSPGPDVIYSQIQSGNEAALRKNVAERQNIELEKTRQSLLGQIAVQSQGKPLDQRAIDLVNGLTSEQLADPDLSLEQLYSRRILKDLYGSEAGYSGPKPRTLRDDAYASNDKVAAALDDTFEEIVTQRQVVQRAIEDLGGEFDQMSIAGKAGDVISYGITNVIPFVRQWDLHNAAHAPFPTSFLPGSNSQEQYVYLSGLGPKEFRAALTQTVSDLRQHSTLLAREFLQGFLTYSGTDSFLDNAFAVADVVGAASLVAKPIMGAARGSVSGIRFTKGARTAKDAQAFNDAVRGAQSAGDAASVVGPVDRSMSGDRAVWDLLQQGKTHDEVAQELGMDLSEVRRVEDAIANPAFNPVGDYAGDFGPIPKAVTLQPEQQYGSALKETIKTLDPRDPDLKQVASAAGRADLAAYTKFAQAISAKLPTAGVRQLWDDLVNSLPSSVDPGKFWRGPMKLTREYADNLVARAEKQLDTLAKAINETSGVSSVSPAGLAKAFVVAESQLRDDMARHGVSDMIIDFERIFPEKSIDNSAYEVLRLGKPGGRFFDNQTEAEAAIRSMGLKDGVPEHSGQGWFVQISRPVKERGDDITPFILDANNRTPKSWFSTLLDSFGKGGGSKFRTPSERLSPEQLGVRQSAVQRPSRVSELVKMVGQPINDLSKSSRERLRQFLDLSARYQERLPSGELKKGIEFTTQGSFETAWNAAFGVNPSADESFAYYAAQNLGWYDYVEKNLSLEHFLARQGVREYKFAPDSDYFRGILKDKIDWEDKRGNILFVSPQGDTKVYIKRLQSQTVKDEFDRLIKEEGYQLIQAVDPWVFSKKAPVNFVLTKTADSRNLPWKIIPYKGGGHIKYDYDNFVKQGILTKGADGTWYHSGDRTVIPTTTTAEAREINEALEVARQHYIAGQRTAFDAHVGTTLAGRIDSESLWNRFRNGSLDKDVPFVHVRSGESTMRTAKMQEVYGQAQSWNDDPLNVFKGANLEFTGRRGWDVQNLTEAADETDPLFEAAKPRLVDPLTMIAHATGRAIRNRFFQDYQIRSAEHFVEEFYPVLRDGKARLNELRQNPLNVLRNPEWSTAPDVDRKLLAAARGYQDAALNLIGTSTEWQRWDRWTRGKLLDSIYNKLGKGAAETVYEKVLPWTPDPIKFARQVAFHTKLGLFNPVQLFLQAQTFTNTLALSPTHGVQGAMAAWLMRLAAVGDSLAENDAKVAHFAKLASNFGWKAEDFEEAYRFMRQSGIFNIGPQHAWRSDTLDPQVFRGKAGSWLDKSLIFFNEGERSNHLAGFATAYHEWKANHPFDKLTRTAEEAILRRYDDLTGNMTHASSSALNRGFGAVAGQFFSYQERLAELMLGHRLSATEKLRAFAVYSAMYGIPVAIGGFSTIPFYEEVRKRILQQGAQNNLFVETLSQGIPEVMLHAALGSEYDFGNRYGPNGIPLWKDIWQNDKTLWDILTGASMSVLGDTFQSTIPVMVDIGKYLTDDPDISAKVLVSDIQNVLSNVSTVGNAQKAFYAINAGKYINKGLIVIDDEVSTLEGLMMGVFGLTPSRINDVQVMQDAVQGRRDAQANARQQAIRYWKLYWMEDDPEAARGYASAARTWMLIGGLNLKERGDLVHDAMTQVGTKRKQILQQFNRVYPEVQ